jgi:hypothetical protein
VRRTVVVLALSAVASAQDLSPRVDSELEERIARANEAPSASWAAGRLAAIMDDPGTEDACVGVESFRAVLRGARAEARACATRRAGRDAAFRDAWELEAERRLSHLSAPARLAEATRVAARFDGTAAAARVWRRMAEAAWEEGDLEAAAAALDRLGRRLEASDVAREVLARRAAGAPASVREEVVRWERRRPGGLRRPPAFERLAPRADARLVVRGKATTLSAWLAAQPPPGPRAETPRAGRRVDGTPSEFLIASAAAPVRFREPGLAFTDISAGADHSRLRVSPFGGAIWVTAESSWVRLRGGAGGWRPAEGAPLPMPRAPLPAWTDSRRLIHLVQDRTLVVCRGPDQKIAWTAGRGNTGPGESDPFADAVFSGAPALGAEAVFVPCIYREDGLVAALACFDARTGALRWSTPLATRFGVREVATFNSGAAPAVHGSRVVVQTNGGITACLDALSGDIEWVFSYQPVDRGWSSEGPVASGGSVFVAPSDDVRATLHDIVTGRVLRDVPVGDASGAVFWQVASRQGRPVLFGSLPSPDSTRPRGVVKILNPAPARDVTWELPDLPAGRSAVDGGRAWIPTLPALLSLDLDSGALDVVHEWKGASEAGDLTAWPGWIASARDGVVLVWALKD